MRQLSVLMFLILLVGCSSRPSLAPVVELKWQPQNAHQTTHTVRYGETLYAVAFRYDQDYRTLAVINNLHSPYSLRAGQILRLRIGGRNHLSHPSPRSAYRPSLRKRSPYLPFTINVRPSSMKGQQWIWPATGSVATKFIPLQGKKGIDIAGKKGEKVRAACNGVVAYAGSGLTGYGNLIIIKHENQILTAYGNNSHNIVNEGQKVKAGQIIAEMGIIDRRFWGVHFEIRKAGKPVNPLDYLKKG